MPGPRLTLGSALPTCGCIAEALGGEMSYMSQDIDGNDGIHWTLPVSSRRWSARIRLLFALA
eukprot:scaffold150508_cov21-Tisochrysis_lutea.AAC.3